jgi:hypothetical protein
MAYDCGYFQEPVYQRFFSLVPFVFQNRGGGYECSEVDELVDMSLFSDARMSLIPPLIYRTRLLLTSLNAWITITMYIVVC